jgi:hypothetical protein
MATLENALANSVVCARRVWQSGPGDGRALFAIPLPGNGEIFPHVDAQRLNAPGDFRVEKHHATVGEGEHDALAVLVADDLALGVLQGHGDGDIGREA